MDTGFAPIGRTILSLILSCAGIACAQNSGPASASAGSASMSSAVGSAGAADYSASSSLSDVGVSASVSNVGVNAVASGVLANAAPGGRGGRESSASIGNSGFSGKSSTGWGQSSSTSTAAVTPSASTGHTSLSALQGAASSGAGTAKQLRQAGLRMAASQHAMAAHGPKGNELEPSLSAKISPGKGAVQSSGGEATSAGGGSGSGNGRFSTDFPDSTRNTAAVNPSGFGNDNLFVFEPSLKEGFPDLAEYEFLKPTLHVSGARSFRGTQQQEDLYRRINRRLNEYKQAEVPKNGLKKEKRSQSPMGGGLGNPFGSRTSTTSAEEKLNKRLNPGPSF